MVINSNICRSLRLFKSGFLLNSVVVNDLVTLYAKYVTYRRYITFCRCP